MFNGAEAMRSSVEPIQGFLCWKLLKAQPPRMSASRAGQVGRMSRTCGDEHPQACTPAALPTAEA